MKETVPYAQHGLERQRRGKQAEEPRIRRHVELMIYERSVRTGVKVRTGAGVRTMVRVRLRFRALCNGKGCVRTGLDF